MNLSKVLRILRSMIQSHHEQFFCHLFWTLLHRASCIVAVIFFFYGAGVSSNHHARANAKPLPAATSASCGYAINAGVFAGGALIALVATVAGVTYYLAVSRMDMDWAEHLKPQSGGGIELGMPTAVPAAVLRTI